MKMDSVKETPQRKRARLKNFSYDTSGAYFITICTQNRRKILSQIVGDDVTVCEANDGVPNVVKLLPHGKIIDKYINQLNEFNDNITVDQYVIIPNHIHILLRVLDNGAPRTMLLLTRTSPLHQDRRQLIKCKDKGLRLIISSASAGGLVCPTQTIILDKSRFIV